MTAEQERELTEAISGAAFNAFLVFEREGWTWLDSNDKKYVPQPDQIAATYRRLFNDMRENHSFSLGTGRLLIQRDDLHGYSFLMRLGNLDTDEWSAV